MSLLPGFIDKILSEKGDEMFATVTKSLRQVIKIRTKNKAVTFVKYPGTGTIVETRVHRK